MSRITFMPKTIQKFQTDSRVDSFSDERDTGDGYWFYLKSGFICGNTGTHCVHEWNVKDVVDAFNTVEACDCEECKEGD